MLVFVPSQQDGRRGDRLRDDPDLTTATTMYREMGMAYWLEMAEAEMTKPGG
jgi:hypothetical protein